MVEQRHDSSLRDARFLTIVVLIVLCIGIALANTSTDLLTIDILLDVIYQQKSVAAPYGWPLTWYWRNYAPRTCNVPPAEYGRPLLGFWHNLQAPWQPQSPISRVSARHFAADLAIWLILLVATSVGCRWLLLRYRRRFRLWPRLSTLAVWTIPFGLILLANLSCDGWPESGVPTYKQFSYGWPIIWYRYIDMANMVTLVRVWDYSLAALAGNVAALILTLAATALMWDWLLCRFRPQFRWNLKMMLAGIAMAGAVIACYATARDRANEQDLVTALIGGDGNVDYESCGPQWLDLVGAARLRRRIVAARLGEGAMNDSVFDRLANVKELRLLEIQPELSDGQFEFTPVMATALVKMQQIRRLDLNCQGSDRGKSRIAMLRCLAAVGHLAHLEWLRLTLSAEDCDGLATLTDLKNLKALTLQIVPCAADENAGLPEAESELRTLESLPALPTLEYLELREWEIGDHNIERLVCIPQLKALDLCYTSVSDTGLAKLARLDSLEELTIDVDIVTAATFEALSGFKCLKAVHITTGAQDNMTVQDKLMRRARTVVGEPCAENALRPGILVLDDGYELITLVDEVDGLNASVAALRQSHPRIVIDAGGSRLNGRPQFAPRR